MTLQRCFISRERNPYVNLSIEEYYLKNSKDNFFILYMNSPSVVVGKHQNLLKEFNILWANKHKINICRRISGGGTVYQDYGNLNFSFIINCANLEKVNYKEFTFPIVQALNSFGIKAENSDRNDLLLKGMKISGNAMHIFKNRVLCHGTLLYNSNLNDLSTALKNNPQRYTDKSIRSVPSKVTNISEHLPAKINIWEFTDLLFYKTMDYLINPDIYNPSESEKREFIKLSQEKYSTWEWIYSYSPKYLYRNSLFLNDQDITFELEVEKGIIRNVTTLKTRETDFFFKLINRRHDLSSLNDFYLSEKIQQFFPHYSQEDFSSLFF